MILVFIRQWRLGTACGLACHINIGITVAGSCPQRQDSLNSRSTAMTHCYSKLHQSCPHSHRSRHRKDCWPHTVGCSRAWNPSDSSCWLHTVKFINVLDKATFYSQKCQTCLLWTIISARTITSICLRKSFEMFLTTVLHLLVWLILAVGYSITR